MQNQIIVFIVLKNFNLRHFKITFFVIRQRHQLVFDVVGN